MSETSKIETERAFTLVGQVPKDRICQVEKAIKKIPKCIFFDEIGQRLTGEVSKLDELLYQHLRESGVRVEKNFSPFESSSFNCDLALPDFQLLIEIEKGKQPRLELDILKMFSAAAQHPNQWHYGLLIIPSTFITLALAGRQTPAQYLARLANLTKPLSQSLTIHGIGVLPYKDPRQ